MKNLDFTYKGSGLETSFRITSKVPAEYKPVWDFGDYTDPSEEVDPVHTFEVSGFYQVTLTLLPLSEEVEEISVTKVVIVSEFAVTHLTDSIYNLIDFYIPTEADAKMSTEEKAMYITKWQLYLQPLVDHEIPIEEYSNELYYEGLENQLIMECAIYEFLYNKITTLMAKASEMIQEAGTTSERESQGNIKQITTGPTEVQYYDAVNESISSMYKAYSTALADGGWLDQVRKNLCMLAERLDIYLPICTAVRRTTIPRVVNRRKPGPLGGPNPASVVRRPGGSIIK